ncbi:MAG: hypothetical protein HY282_01940 [Nitrospirae bacterium]|nr:hypothetical protein [Candidatus Manganitrophaceae bacterium]
MRRSTQKHLEQTSDAEETEAATGGEPTPLPSSPEAPARGVRFSLGILRGILQFPYAFVIMNTAAIVGLYAFLRRRKNIWVRSTETDAWEIADGSALPVPVTPPTNSGRKAA